MIAEIIGVVTALIIILIAIINNAFGATYAGGRDANTIQRDVARKYKEFRAPKKHPSFQEFCFPRAFNVQRQQKFVAAYMSPKTHKKSLLIFHKIGAGKTCACIQITNQWRHLGRPLIIMPASLIPGFHAELRSPCGGYATAEELAVIKAGPADPEYKRIIKSTDKKISTDYQIYSYNSFQTAIESGKRIVAPIICVDEVQNIVGGGAFYRAINKWITARPEIPVVLLTGTPIFDHAIELVKIAELMRLNLLHPIDGNIVFSPDDVRNVFAGHVSFYAGAPDYTFPRTIVKILKCKMSPFQARWYRSDIEAEIVRGEVKTHVADNNFYVKSRQSANIVCPRGLIGDAGVRALTTSAIRDHLSTYSCKYAKLIAKVKKGRLGFAYASFTGAGGITSIAKILRAFGYSDFADAGPGKRRFAIFSGEQTGHEKNVIVSTFNAQRNDDASQIQLIIGSPAMKEGVSLFRVRDLFCLDPYWNHSRLEQIFGRGSRYCSHKTLPRIDRDITIYIFAAVSNADKHANGSDDISPDYSIDLYMLQLADRKRDLAEPFVSALIDCAADKLLNYPGK